MEKLEGLYLFSIHLFFFFPFYQYELIFLNASFYSENKEKGGMSCGCNGNGEFTLIVIFFFFFDISTHCLIFPFRDGNGRFGAGYHNTIPFFATHPCPYPQLELLGNPHPCSRRGNASQTRPESPNFIF